MFSPNFLYYLYFFATYYLLILSCTIFSLSKENLFSQSLFIFFNVKSNCSFSFWVRHSNICIWCSFHSFNAIFAVFIPLSVNTISIALRSFSLYLRVIMPVFSKLDNISLAEPGCIPKYFVNSFWFIVILSCSQRTIKILFRLAFPSWSARILLLMCKKPCKSISFISVFLLSFCFFAF